MLSEAVDQMLKTQAVSKLKEQQLPSKQHSQMHQLDHWLGQVEDLLEVDQTTVPPIWFKEIAKCLRRLAPPLHQELLSISDRSASLVLNVLFDAQEMLRRRSRQLIFQNPRTKKKDSAIIA